MTTEEVVVTQVVVVVDEYVGDVVVVGDEGSTDDIVVEEEVEASRADVPSMAEHPTADRDTRLRNATNGFQSTTTSRSLWHQAPTSYMAEPQATAPEPPPITGNMFGRFGRAYVPICAGCLSGF